MIKFFRNIRRNLMETGKIGRYLKYAIGEILLVVIGILIALQFNNQNEKRKSENEVFTIMDKLENDLLYNFNESTRILEFYKEQDKICKQVLFDDLTIEDYRKNDLISIVIANWFALQPKTENLTLLLDNQKIAPKNLTPIINAAKLLKDREYHVNQDWENLNENIQHNMEELTRHVSLIRLDSVSKQKRFEYMLTNEDYKKRVELYWIRIQNYYDKISRFRAQNMAVLSTIKIIRDEYSSKELKALYTHIGMNPFKEINCNMDNYIKDEQALRRGYLIGNLSPHEITLIVKNDGKIGGAYVLKSNEFRYTRPEYAGLGGDYTTIAELRNTDGNCIRKYTSTEKGYILINEMR